MEEVNKARAGPGSLELRQLSDNLDAVVQDLETNFRDQKAKLKSIDSIVDRELS